MFTLQRDDLYRLHQLSDEADRLIQTTLRCYTGLFSDYAYIDEELLALRTYLTHDQVYQIFRHLSQQHIVSYIPAKSTPYIIYTRERMELSELHFSKEIYEMRKKRLENQLDAIIHYAENDVNCRSRMLLNYFGEDNPHNCGICDTCIEQKRKS